MSYKELTQSRQASGAQRFALVVRDNGKSRLTNSRENFANIKNGCYRARLDLPSELEALAQKNLSAAQQF